MPNTVAAIPAHLGSTRLPRKVLVPIQGQPLLWHVWQSAVESRAFNRVVILTDSDQIRQLASKWGAESLATRSGLQCGTDRIASVSDAFECDCIVNVQADMPRIDPQLFHDVLRAWQEHPDEVITPVFRIREQDQLFNADLVKVVLDAESRALYFSRQPIPHYRDKPAESWPSSHDYWGHVGIYAFSLRLLREFAKLPVSPLEQVEKLEQLRFLAAGVTMRTIYTDRPPHAIDSLADLRRADELPAGISRSELAHDKQGSNLK